MNDFTYAQAYADWQSELRESAARASAARRSARDPRTGSPRRGLAVLGAFLGLRSRAVRTWQVAPGSRPSLG